MARSKIEPIDESSQDESLPPLSPTWKRVRAGLLVEGGLIDAEVTRAWQEAVRDGDFDPDQCADEILEEDPGPMADAQLERRSGVLLRELLMAPLAAGGRRRGGRKVKTGAAVLLSQLFMLAVWGGLFFAGILLFRVQEYSVDVFLDKILSIFH